MIGLGIARGLNEGMADIEARRRQEMLDRERQEDRAREAELYRIKMEEYNRDLGLRTQREAAGKAAWQAPEYSYQDADTADPEFGVAAQLQMGGATPEEAYKQQAGLRGGPEEFNRPQYLSEMERIAAESGDFEGVEKLRQASQQLRAEGGQEAVRLMLAGDLRGAERAWNSVGRDRIQPGTLQTDGKVASFVNGNGQRVQVDVAKLKDLVGIAQEDTGRYKTGEGVIYNDKTGQYEVLPGGSVAGGGSGGGSLEDTNVYALALKRTEEDIKQQTALLVADPSNENVRKTLEELYQQRQYYARKLAPVPQVGPEDVAQFTEVWNAADAAGREKLRLNRPELYAAMMAAQTTAPAPAPKGGLSTAEEQRREQDKRLAELRGEVYRSPEELEAAKTAAERTRIENQIAEVERIITSLSNKGLGVAQWEATWRDLKRRQAQIQGGVPSPSGLQ